MALINRKHDPGLVSLGNYNCNYKLNAYRIWVMISRDKIACANSFSFLEGYIELMEILGIHGLNTNPLTKENPRG